MSNTIITSPHLHDVLNHERSQSCKTIVCASVTVTYSHPYMTPLKNVIALCLYALHQILQDFPRGDVYDFYARAMMSVQVVSGSFGRSLLYRIYLVLQSS